MYPCFTDAHKWAVTWVSGVKAKKQGRYLECKLPVSYIKWQIYDEIVIVACSGVTTGLIFDKIHIHFCR